MLEKHNENNIERNFDTLCKLKRPTYYCDSLIKLLILIKLISDI